MNYCRDCHHTFTDEQLAQWQFDNSAVLPIVPRCPWCESRNVGAHCQPVKPQPKFTDPVIPQRDAAEQAKYPVGCRLSRGFSILNGGDV
ncbi:MAG: hypothetical protein JWQ87_5407 [Candidatus Sulfotelmatobacter sp.]|nr:hypothetical protein [Candidatus Sulfotelmatobacter sp.]